MRIAAFKVGNARPREQAPPKQVVPDGEHLLFVRVKGLTMTVLDYDKRQAVGLFVLCVVLFAFFLGALVGAAVHRVVTDPPRAEVTDASPTSQAP